jgi:hypothetical protein
MQGAGWIPRRRSPVASVDSGVQGIHPGSHPTRRCYCVVILASWGGFHARWTPKKSALSLAIFRASPPSIRRWSGRNRKISKLAGGGERFSVSFGRRLHRKNRRKTCFGKGFARVFGDRLTIANWRISVAAGFHLDSGSHRVSTSNRCGFARTYDPESIHFNSLSLANRLDFQCLAKKCLASSEAVNRTTGGRSCGDSRYPQKPTSPSTAKNGRGEPISGIRRSAAWRAGCVCSGNVGPVEQLVAAALILLCSFPKAAIQAIAQQDDLVDRTNADER